jgi:hypothetical protein
MRGSLVVALVVASTTFAHAFPDARTLARLERAGYVDMSGQGAPDTYACASAACDRRSAVSISFVAEAASIGANFAAMSPKERRERVALLKERSRTDPKRRGQLLSIRSQERSGLVLLVEETVRTGADGQPAYAVIQTAYTPQGMRVIVASAASLPQARRLYQLVAPR